MNFKLEPQKLGPTLRTHAPQDGSNNIGRFALTDPRQLLKVRAQKRDRNPLVRLDRMVLKLPRYFFFTPLKILKASHEPKLSSIKKAQNFPLMRDFKRLINVSKHFLIKEKNNIALFSRRCRYTLFDKDILRSS